MDQVNDIIKKYIGDTSRDNPGELSNDLILLSAGLYSVGNAVVNAEISYAKKWSELRMNYESDKACEYRMKTEPEYQEVESRKIAQKVVLEIIRSIKKRIMVLSDESRNQY